MVGDMSSKIREKEGPKTDFLILRSPTGNGDVLYRKCRERSSFNLRCGELCDELSRLACPGTSLLVITECTKAAHPVCCEFVISGGSLQCTHARGVKGASATEIIAALADLARVRLVEFELKEIPSQEFAV